MKRAIFTLLALVVGFLLSSCTKKTDDMAQLQEDGMAQLQEYLDSIGYDGSMELRELNNPDSDSVDYNVRSLIGSLYFKDKPKESAELILKSGCFSVLADTMNFYLPEDSEYRTGHYMYHVTGSAFLWAIILLEDYELPQEYEWIWDAIAEIAKNPDETRFNSVIAFAFLEKNNPGFYEKYYPGRSTNELDYPFAQLGGKARDTMIEHTDFSILLMYGPHRIYGFEESESLLHDYPSTEAWQGSYVYFLKKNDYPYEVKPSYNGEKMFWVSNPKYARFAIYEERGIEYYDDYYYKNRKSPVKVYIPKMNIRIVDLVSGEEIINETVLDDPPGDSFNTDAIGKFVWSDRFDYEKYVSIMESLVK